MNPLVIHIVSGNAFYSGSALLALCALLGGRPTRSLRAPVSLAAILGFLLVVLSATPLPIWFYVIWSVSVGFWLLVRESSLKMKPRMAIFSLVTVIGLTIAAVFLNAQFMSTPRILLPRTGRIYALGDSLSAHYTQSLPWPDRLTAEHGIDVVNLAQPGATAQFALSQARQIDSTNSLVVLLIGGNDILGNTTAAQFETDLNRLLAEVQHRTMATVMFELPLPPFMNRFGSIQRALSRQYGVVLIPKRHLACVIGSPGATADGLHLSDIGQEQMTTLLWHMMAR